MKPWQPTLSPSLTDWKTGANSYLEDSGKDKVEKK